MSRPVQHRRPRSPNMKSVFLSGLALLVCSGHVALGDLEFYPEYKRSDAEIPEDDWLREPPPNPQAVPRFFEKDPFEDRERSPYPYGALRRGKTAKELDPSWPSTIARHLLTNKELALRLLHRNEKAHQPSRNKQYFKVLPSGRDPSFNRHFEDKEATALLSLFNDDFGKKEVLEDDADVKEEEEEEEEDTPPNYETDDNYNPREFGYSPTDKGYFGNPEDPVTIGIDYKVEDMEEKGPDHFVYNNQDSLEEREVQGLDVVTQKANVDDTAGVYIIAVVAGISAAATVGLIAFGIGWYNLQKHVKNASDVDYPAYGVTGPNKEVSPSGDRRLAQSAQMYHYQHQKQQIIAMERAAANERHGSVSEAESDEENEEGDYTVYECPGLAPTGEMEVKNPMFQDDPTPAQTPGIKSQEGGGK